MSRGWLVGLSASEAERLLLRKVEAAKDNPIEPLWELGRFYGVNKRPEAALGCLRQVMARLPDAERRGACLLAMGQAMEHVERYEAAIGYYREALSLEPIRTESWYFINNNLGYSLNTLGNVREGESYCRRAIGIDSTRPNAYKNLGISLAGQGRFAEAAECFIAGTRANANDGRSLDLLMKLLADHPEMKPDYGADVEQCLLLRQQAVEAAALEAARSRPVIHRGFWKQVLLLRLRLWYFFRRARGERRAAWAADIGIGETRTSGLAEAVD